MSSRVNCSTDSLQLLAPQLEMVPIANDLRNRLQSPQFPQVRIASALARRGLLHEAHKSLDVRLRGGCGFRHKSNSQVKASATFGETRVHDMPAHPQLTRSGQRTDGYRSSHRNVVGALHATAAKTHIGKITEHQPIVALRFHLHGDETFDSRILPLLCIAHFSFARDDGRCIRFEGRWLRL